MRTRTLLLSLSILAVAVYAAANRLYAQAKSNDEAQIRALEERYAAAFRAKDIDTIMKAYARGAELFVFDVTPPRQHVGFDDYKKDWQDLFAAFPGPVDKFEVQDLSIMTDGKLAYSHSVQPAIFTAKDGSKFSLTARVTDCYRKINGKWLITQEHVSVPVNLDTGNPDIMSRP